MRILAHVQTVARLTNADFMECVKTLKNDVPAIHSRLISGTKISRADATKEVEVLKEFYTLTRICDGQYRHEVDELRTAAAGKVKTVFLPPISKTD